MKQISLCCFISQLQIKQIQHAELNKTRYYSDERSHCLGVAKTRYRTTEVNAWQVNNGNELKNTIHNHELQ